MSMIVAVAIGVSFPILLGWLQANVKEYNVKPFTISESIN